MKEQRFFAALCLIVSTALAAHAQEEESPVAPEGAAGREERLYIKGDMDVFIGIAPVFPLFTHAFNFSDFTKANLNVGIGFDIGLEFYWTNNLKFGLAVSLAHAQGVNGNSAFFIPITARAMYEFHFYQLSVPVGGELGMFIGSYRGMTALNPIIKPRAGAYWHFTSSWSAGLSLSWWIVPQITWKEMNKSRVSSLLEVSLSGQYHF